MWPAVSTAVLCDLHANEEHYSVICSKTFDNEQLSAVSPTALHSRSAWSSCMCFPLTEKLDTFCSQSSISGLLLVRFTTSSAEHKRGSAGDIILLVTCVWIYLSDEYINFLNLRSPQNPDRHSASIQTLTSHILRIAAVMFLRPKNGGITALITAANRLLSPHGYSINKSIKKPLEASCCGHAKTQQWAQGVWINEGFWQDVAVLLKLWAGITSSLFFNFIND